MGEKKIPQLSQYVKVSIYTDICTEIRRYSRELIMFDEMNDKNF